MTRVYIRRLSSLAVLLLVLPYDSLSAASPNRIADIGSFDGPQELCYVTLQAQNHHWLAGLSCNTPTDHAPEVQLKIDAAAVWLLLDNGRAAVPTAGSRGEGVATCGIGCSVGLNVEFEIPQDSVALVVKYDGKFRVFPITKENREKL